MRFTLSSAPAWAPPASTAATAVGPITPSTQAVSAPALHAASLTLDVSDRCVFWRALLDWQASAPADEIDQLQALLVDHAPHVRPLAAALADAIRARDERLPASLLAVLGDRGMLGPAQPTRRPPPWH